MTDTPDAVRIADPIKPLADAPIVAWCIESTDGADWCWSATRDGVIDNAKFLDDGCAPGEPFAVIRQADHQAQMNALLRRIPELEAEVQEQARLNGMGAERELALMAQVSRLEAERDQLRAELENVRVPEGWKLVPVEPTREMLDRGSHNVNCNYHYGTMETIAKHAYKAMLTAAPTPPNADQKGQ